jgi:hypothetical protein
MAISKVGGVLSCYGTNFRCGICHNGHGFYYLGSATTELWIPAPPLPEVELYALLKFTKKTESSLEFFSPSVSRMRSCIVAMFGFQQFRFHWWMDFLWLFCTSFENNALIIDSIASPSFSREK